MKGGRKKEAETTEKSIEESVAELSTDKEKCVDLNFMVYTYGKFHNNKINQIIHIIFVPIILYTWYVQMCIIAPYYEFSFDVPFFGSKIGFGIVPYFFTLSAYFFIDWQVALTVSAWWWPVMILGNACWMNHADELYWGMSQFRFMGIVNALSWIAQFIGHGLFEQRAPAILTNLGFATLAPFFITFEVMNVCLGFREGETMRKLRSYIEQDIEEYHGVKQQQQKTHSQ